MASGGSGCYDKLRNYSDFLSNNDTQINSDNPLPHPLFFSDVDCKGDMWPSFDSFIDEKVPLSPVNFTTFESFYLPSNWQMFVQDAGGSSRLFCSSQNPITIEDIDRVNYDLDIANNTCQTGDHNIDPTTVTLKNVIGEVQVQRVVPNTGRGTITSAGTSTGVGIGIEYSTDCWKYQMCNNQTGTIVGSNYITSWDMGTEECDLFMGGLDNKGGWCSETGGYPCQRIVDSTVSNFTLPACACLKDEQDLQHNFCQPNNTSSQCDSQGSFKEFIPVTCFGKNCSLTGYRFHRMQNQQCKMTLCEQTINLIGDSIVIDTESTIYCGTKVVSDVSPTVTAIVINSGSGTLETYEWALIVLFTIVLFVLLPLSIILFRRSYQNDFQDTIDKKKALVSNVKYFGIKGLSMKI